MSKGLWYPEFTFSTKGDLSVVYSTQYGSWSLVNERFGLLKFQSDFTPTFTTASGQAAFIGFPQIMPVIVNNTYLGNAIISGITGFDSSVAMLTSLYAFSVPNAILFPSTDNILLDASAMVSGDPVSISGQILFVLEDNPQAD